VAELLAHAAVDEEVDRIAEQDEEIDELFVQVAMASVQQTQ